MTRCDSRKKKRASVTPVVSMAMQDDDDDDDSDDAGEEKDNAEELRSPESSMGINAVLRLKKIAKHVKAKASSLAELRKRQEEEMEQLEEDERSAALQLLKELPTEEDSTSDDGLIEELAQLRQLHSREVTAIETLFEFKKELAFAELREAAQRGKEQEEGAVKEQKATIALEEEKIEKELNKLEHQMKQDEQVRQARQLRDVKGDGVTLRAEIKRLKEQLGGEEEELFDSVNSGRKKALLALENSLSARNELDEGSELDKCEIELAKAKFELETQQQEQAVRQKEHRRQLVCLGEPVDVDAEMKWLEALHEQSRAALDRLLAAEEARRKAKLADRTESRKQQIGAVLQKKGVQEGDEDFLAAMTNIEEDQKRELQALEAQCETEKKFYIGQLEEKNQREKNQSADFNAQLQALRAQHEKSSKEVQDQIRAEHSRKSAELKERLAARRAKKAAVLEQQKASPEEVTEEMNELQELDSQELNQLSAELAQSVAGSISESDAYQKTQMQDLIKEDEEVEHANMRSKDELRRLIDAQQKSRVELENSLEAKRRGAGAKLKMRLASKKQKVMMKGGLTGGVQLAQINEEELKELNRLDMEQGQSEATLWSKAHESTEKMVLRETGLQSELQDDMQSAMKDIRAQHQAATDELNKSLASKQRQKKEDLKRRLEAKRKKLKAQNLGEDELAEKVDEIEEEEANELEEISTEAKHELESLQRAHADEKKQARAVIEEQRAQKLREAAERLEEERRHAGEDAERMKALHAKEIKELDQQQKQKAKAEKERLNKRLAMKRKKREQELGSREKVLEEERKAQEELKARLEAEHEVEKNRKQLEADNAEVAAELDAQIHEHSVESKARLAEEIEKEKRRKAEEESQQQANVQEMVEQQKKEAQRLEDSINKEMENHHDRLKDRVKNRRQKRHTKIKKQASSAKQELQKKQAAELQTFEDKLLSEGNSEEARRVEAMRLEVSEKEVDRLKSETETLKSENEVLKADVERLHGEAMASEKEQGELMGQLTEQMEAISGKLEKEKAAKKKLKKAKEKLEEELVLMEEQLEAAKAQPAAGAAPPGVDSEMKNKLAAAEAAVEAKTEELDEANQKLEVAEAGNEALEEERALLEKLLEEAKDEMKHVGPLQERAEKLDQVEQKVLAAEKHNQEMSTTLKKEQMLRKKLHNKLEDMKGAIRVFARGRPMSKDELARGTGEAVDYLDPTSVRITNGTQDVAGAGTATSKDYIFDSVFGPNSTQEEVFEDTESLLDSVIDGYNVCIFAYGQTGSGKTFTMGGTKDMPGLTPRCVSGLVERVREGREEGYEFAIKVYFVELYNDQILDLLAPKQDKKLDIKIDANKQVYCKNAVAVDVSADPSSIMKTFDDGNKKRKVGATKMNAESSRSHSILGIVVESTNPSGKKTFGKLSLIDLAGSERSKKTGATKAQLKEANSINKSLSSLGDVIGALTTGADFVPYRNNKLTQLMQDSLGGSAKTLMFVNFSPADYNAEETMGSLTYATRVKQIKNNVEKAVESKEVAVLKAKILTLQRQLLAGGAGGGTAEDDESSASASASGSEGSDDDDEEE